MMKQRHFLPLLVLLSTCYKSFGFVTFPPPSMTTMATKTATPSMMKHYASSNKDNEQMTHHDENASFITPSSRRNFVAASSLLISSGLGVPLASANAASTTAATTDFTPYMDSEYNFQISLPTNWVLSEQKLSDRRKIVFSVDNNTKEGEDKTLVFIAYTPVRDDFTSLSSFGSVDQVAQAQILPKGQVGLMDETESEMLSAESKKNAYYFDYTIKVPDQPKRHFRTIFDLKQQSSGSAGAVLVSITAQTTSDKYDGSGLQTLFDEIVNSYGKIPK